MFEVILAQYEAQKLSPVRMAALSFLALGERLTGKGFIQDPHLRCDLATWEAMSDEDMSALFARAL